MIRTPLAASIAPLVIGSILLQPAAMWAQSLGGGSTQSTADRELARRLQREVNGREEIAKGGEAMRKKDYEAAFAHFKNACENIPAGAPAMAESRKAAAEGFTKAGIRFAEQRVTEGYYESAVLALREVLRQVPNDGKTLRLLSNIEAPDYFNKQMTPQHRAKVEEVKQLFIQADGYKNLGRYDLAQKKYEEVQDKDPYNIAAVNGREELANLKDRYGRAAYNSTRSEAMWEVDKEWARPHRRFNSKSSAIISTTSTTAPNTAAINLKLNSIKFPKIDFRDSTVREAIEFLVQKSKSLDEKGEGVNIVLRLGDEGGGGGLPAPAAPAPAAGIPGLDNPAAGGIPGVPGGGGGSGTRITLTLNNVPLIEVIKYITNLANLKYKIEPFAVNIVPLGTQTDELFIKQWKVPPSIFRSAPANGGQAAAAPGGVGLGAPPAAPGLGAASDLGGQSNARDYLQQQGVTFGQGTLALYSPASSTLIVKNTQDQLDLVERIIEIGGTGEGVKQIEIQAKFVEISQTNTKELSFDWMLGQSNIPHNYNVFTGGGTSGNGVPLTQAAFPFTFNAGDAPVTSGNRSGSYAITGNAIDALLAGTTGQQSVAPGIVSITGAGTDPTFQMVMRGLNQKKGVDLLSAPRVTTKSGQRAVVEVIREFKYPTEFSAPQIPQTLGAGAAALLGGGIGGGGGGSFPVTPTTPTAFEKRDTGVTLEVEPTIGPDGYSIDMQLAPQVVEFEGFINYGSPIQTTSTNPITGASTTNVLTPNIINQPIFSTRKVSTNVTVFDGATVVLGGLIREDVQKVEDKTPIFGDLPLVGRLFRSNVDQHIKRNLVIFVTARLVNPEGAPITSDEEKEESVDALPLPEIAPPSMPDIGGKTYRPLETRNRSYRPIQTSMPVERNGALNPAARRLEP
jgi:general secretion pathway protein D